MTSILAVNPNNDIFLTSGGSIATRQDLQAVLQQAEHAIKAQLSEMIYAADRGLNTFDSVWSGSPNLLSFEASARTSLNRIPDIVSVTDFTATLDGQTVSYTTTIRTVFGQQTVSGSTNGGL